MPLYDALELPTIPCFAALVPSEAFRLPPAFYYRTLGLFLSPVFMYPSALPKRMKYQVEGDVHFKSQSIHCPSGLPRNQTNFPSVPPAVRERVRSPILPNRA